MKIVIEQRHTLNTSYNNCGDCALDRAIREQYPIVNYSKDFAVAGTFVWLNGKMITFGLNKFKPSDFLKIQRGEIKKFELEIPFTEQPKVKEVIRYVTVSDTLKEQAKELITQQ